MIIPVFVEVRLLSTVNQRVLLPFVERFGFPIAMWALEIMMSSKVTCKIILPEKSFLTVIADKELLSSMDLNVPSQLLIRSECFTAALKRYFFMDLKGLFHEVISCLLLMVLWAFKGVEVLSMINGLRVLLLVVLWVLGRVEVLSRMNGLRVLL